MRIVIAGAGAVGFNLARELTADQHDIVVIEAAPEKIYYVSERVDVTAINGSATDVDILLQAKVQDADVFIAVTDSDEVNIVACSLAYHVGARRRIARVRNPHLSSEEALANKREFHINRVVNPDELATRTAISLVDNPGVTFSAAFADGEVLLRAFKLTESSGIHGKPLHKLAQKFPERPFLVAAIQRNGSVIIPKGGDILQVDDTVYLLMLKESESEFQKLVATDTKQGVGRVAVYGAETVGLDIMRRLQPIAAQVIALDERRECAELASVKLPNALVLHGFVSDEEVVREADFANIDAFVAASEDDRMNLVAALFAKQRGAKRTFVLAREPDVVPLLEALDFDAVINARLLAVSAISRFVRPGKVLAVQKIGEGTAEAIELLVRNGSKAANKSLRELHLPDGALVGAVFRDGAAFLPTGDTILEVGDDIVAFVQADVQKSVARLFQSKRRLGG